LWGDHHSKVSRQILALLGPAQPAILARNNSNNSGLPSTPHDSLVVPFNYSQHKSAILHKNRRDTCVMSRERGKQKVAATEMAKYVIVPLESSEIGQKFSHGMD
jgi:hypothetical protein